MITIKINKEKKQIPTMEELTVRQYIELVKDDLNIVSYLSVTLGITYKEAFNSKASGLDKLLKRLGSLDDYTKIKPSEVLLIDDEIFTLTDLEVSTVGQRFTIEQNAKKLQNEELLCFILAVAITDEPMNAGTVNELKEKIMNEPYKKVLPAAFFLAMRFSIGRRSAMNYLKMLKRLINMKVFERKREYTGLIPT